jgi:hypothetical protein
MVYMEVLECPPEAVLDGSLLDETILIDIDQISNDPLEPDSEELVYEFH